MPTRETVRITVFHQIGRLSSDAVQDELKDELAYVETTYEQGGELGYQRHKQKKLLIRPDDAGGLLVPAGLVERVRKKLTEAGIPSTIVDTRTFEHRLLPSEQTLETATLPERKIMEAVITKPRALIETLNEADQVPLMALLFRLFPQARIMLATNARRKELKILRKQLQQHSGLQVHLMDPFPWPYEAGRVVCSLQDFDQLNSFDFDMVVFADAHQALVHSHDRAFVRLTHQRVYGFVRVDQLRGGSTELQLLSRFGPVIGTSQPDGHTTAVRVLWASPPWSPPPGPVKALEGKRTAFWHNDQRNDFLAKIASGFADRDEGKLFECGLLLEEDRDTSMPANNLAVTIIADSSEHGLELVRRLPGWEILRRVPRDEHSIIAARNPWKPRPLARTVLTHLAVTELPSIDTDVLIIASANFPEAGWSNRLLPHQVLVVDVADDFDKWARGDVSTRVRSYAARGWITNTKPAWLKQ